VVAIRSKAFWYVPENEPLHENLGLAVPADSRYDPFPPTGSLAIAVESDAIGRSPFVVSLPVVLTTLFAELAIVPMLSAEIASVEIGYGIP
jgi:hypothetical protein